MKSIVHILHLFFMKQIRHKCLVVFLVFLLWLYSLAGNVSTIHLRIANGYLKADIDGVAYGEIPFNAKTLQNLAISFAGDNLPMPNPLKPQIISVEYYDKNGKLHVSQELVHTFSPDTEVVNADIKLKNTLYADIQINEIGNSFTRVLYRVFRERDVNLLNYQNGKIVDSVSRWRQVSIPWDGAIRIYLYIVLCPFPYFVFGLLLVRLLQNIIPTEKYHLRGVLDIFRGNRGISLYSLLVAVTLFVMLFYLLWVVVVYVERIPHSPDGTMYLWMAKLLAAGRLWLPGPYAAFSPKWHLLISANNHPVILWPYGHSLVFVPGVLLGQPWIVPPLVGIAFLYLFYSLVRSLYGRFIAYVSLLTAFFSPFFQMHAVTFMSHNTAVLYLIVYIFTFFKFIQGRAGKVMLFLAGVSVVLLYYTRPLSAVGSVVATIPLVGYLLVKKKIQITPLRWFFLGLAIFFALSVILNYYVYGHPILTFYHIFSRAKFIGGASGHTFIRGLTENISFLMALRLVLLPGLPILFSLLLLTSVVGTNYTVLFFCLLGSLVIFLGMATYDDPFGLFLGPRFIYEIVPFLLLLFASAFAYLKNLLKNSLVGYGVVGLIVLFISFKSIDGWMLGNQPLWDNFIYFTPGNIKELKSFNYTDARLINEAQRQHLTNALILVKECSGWWCYGSVLTQNTADFNGDIVWAQDTGSKNKELIKTYPGRKIYYADYDLGTISPFNTAGL